MLVLLPAGTTTLQKEALVPSADPTYPFLRTTIDRLKLARARTLLLPEVIMEEEDSNEFIATADATTRVLGGSNTMQDTNWNSRRMIGDDDCRWWYHAYWCCAAAKIENCRFFM